MDSLKNIKEGITIEIKYLVFGFLCILMLSIFFAINIHFIGVTTDELGYLSFPAKICGWSEGGISGNFPYYGIGIGILWIPLFYFINDFIIIYRLIIILNGILLCISFLLSYVFLKKHFETNNYKKLFLIASVLILYPSNIYFMQDALAETLLYTLFWSLLFCINKILENDKWYYFIILGIILVYMLLVHLRTLVIVMATVLFLFIRTIKDKKKWYNLFLIFIFIGIGLILLEYAKQWHYNLFGTETAINSINTNLDIAGRIMDIFKKFLPFFKGLIGQLYYFFVAGNIAFFVGSIVCIYEGVKACICFHETKDGIKKRVYLFLGIVLLINIVAFATNKTTMVRTETIVYGRYMENIIGPILAIGLYWLSEQYKYNYRWKNLNYVFMFFVMFATPIILERMESAESKMFGTSSAVAMGGFFEFYIQNVDLSFSLLKVVIVTCGFLCALEIIISLFKYKKLKPYTYLCIMGMFMVYWIYLGIDPIAEQLSMKEENYQKYHEVEKVIEQYDQVDLYYLNDDEANEMNIPIKYLQLLLEHKNIIAIDSEDDVNGSALILVDPGTNISNNSIREIESTLVFDIYYKD